jgi:hypothetical protein
LTRSTTTDAFAPSLVLWIGALAAAVAVAYSPLALADGDTYWHVAAGRWMLAHRQVLKTDVFSYTRLGAPWDAHEWLSEAVMALAFRWGGWNAVLVLFAAAAGATAALMIGWMQRFISGVTLLAIVALSACCMAGSMLARPHLLALPALTAWTIELMMARECGRAPRLAFVALMALWANLHGSCVIGFVLLAGFGLEALAGAAEGERWRTLRDWAAFGLLSLCAAMLTPQGFEGLIYPFKVMGMTTLNLIQEWQPSSFAKLGAMEIALLTTLFVCMSRGVKVPMIRLALLLLLLHMALQHARQQLVLAVVAPLILVAPLASALDQRPTKAWLGGRFWPAMAALAVMLAAMRMAWPVARADVAKSALSHVPARIAALPVLNDYRMGGYLIFNGVRPFIDGRADMYGDSYTEAYAKAIEPDAAALSAILANYKIAWTIFSPSKQVVKAMDLQPGWRRLYVGESAVVHVRTDVMPTPVSPIVQSVKPPAQSARPQRLPGAPSAEPLEDSLRPGAGPGRRSGAPGTSDSSP